MAVAGMSVSEDRSLCTAIRYIVAMAQTSRCQLRWVWNMPPSKSGIKSKQMKCRCYHLSMTPGNGLTVLQAISSVWGKRRAAWWDFKRNNCPIRHLLSPSRGLSAVQWWVYKPFSSLLVQYRQIWSSLLKYYILNFIHLPFNMCLLLGLLLKNKGSKGSNEEAPRLVPSHPTPTTASAPQPYKQ